MSLWHDLISSQSKLEYYCMFKSNFDYEPYLDKILNNNMRAQFSRFRLCSHSLEIEIGRHSRVDRVDRKCKVCNQNSVESEYHF